MSTMQTLKLPSGRVLQALPNDRTERIIASGIRREGEFPRTQFIAWWDHPNCVREFDGKNWSIFATDKAPARVSA